MLSICTNCAGAYRLKQDAAAFRKGIVVFSSIAKFHDFQYLQDTVEWTLQMIPLGKPHSRRQ